MDWISYVALVAAIAANSAPAPEHSPAPASAQAVLFNALKGRWYCNGAFANGKKIGAALTVSTDLDGFGLRLVHSDRPPNNYRAEETWSRDSASGKLVSLAWLGMRGSPEKSPALYVADELSANSVTFVQQQLLAPPWTPNRFRYVVEGRSFHIYWETLSGGEWRLGDSLSCLPAASTDRRRN